MQDQTKAIIRSLSLTSGSSVVGGTGLAYILSTFISIPFLYLIGPLSLSFFAGQFIISYIFGTIRDNRIQTIVAEYASALKGVVQEMRTPITLSCAYCNIQNVVSLSLIEDNAFTCVSCNHINKVYIQLQTTRVTEPLRANINVEEVKDLAVLGEETIRQNTINEPITIERG